MKSLNIQARPLSVNEAWQGRRFKTPKYEAYEKELFFLLSKEDRTTPIEGMVMIHYRFFFKNHKARDFDNPVKPLQDILVKIGVLKDDRYIYRALIDKIPSETDRIEIDIYPYLESEILFSLPIKAKKEPNYQSSF